MNLMCHVVSVGADPSIPFDLPFHFPRHRTTTKVRGDFPNAFSPPGANAAIYTYIYDDTPPKTAVRVYIGPLSGRRSRGIQFGERRHKTFNVPPPPPCVLLCVLAITVILYIGICIKDVRIYIYIYV